MSDAAGTPTDDVTYQNTADQVWASKAIDLYRQHRLQVAAFNEEGVVSAQIWGPCPRCGHDLNVQPTLSTTVPREDRGWWAALLGRTIPGGDEIPAMVEVGCGCGRTHPGAPDKPDGSGRVLGCGVSFHFPTTPAATPPDASAGAPASHTDPQ